MNTADSASFILCLWHTRIPPLPFRPTLMGHASALRHAYRYVTMVFPSILHVHRSVYILDLSARPSAWSG